MPSVDPVAVLAATAVAFLLGGAYYAVLGDKLAALSPAFASSATMPPSTVAIEVVRCLLLALVVAGLAAQGEVDGAAGGVLLGGAVWIGFPLVLWIGAVVHERVRVPLAAIHAGDWLVKLLAVGAVVGLLS